MLLPMYLEHHNEYDQDAQIAENEIESPKEPVPRQCAVVVVVAEVVHNAGDHIRSEDEAFSVVPQVDSGDDGRQHGEIGEGEEEESAVVLVIRHALVLAVSASEVLRAVTGVDQSVSEFVLLAVTEGGVHGGLIETHLAVSGGETYVVLPLPQVRQLCVSLRGRTPVAQ